MTHIHHIIPRHCGGTDDPSNLIELSVEEHAEAHKILFEKYGRIEDKIAWLGLTTQINNEQIFNERSRIGGLKNSGKPKSAEHNRKNSASKKGKPQRGGVVTHREESIKAISKAMIGNLNSSNHKSDEYKKTQSEAMKLAWQRRKSKS